MHKIAYKHKSGEKYLTSPARNHIMKEKAEGSCSASEGKTMTRRKCILIAVLFAGSMLSIAAGCSRTKYEKLAAPQNFEMAWNDVLSWDEVEGADRYAVTVGDATYETSSPSIDLMDITVSSTSRTAAQGISVVPGDSFTLSVAAKSAGGEEYDSEPSEFSYTTLTAVYGFSAGELTFREIREPSTGLTASRKLIMPEKINGSPVNRIANFNELLLEKGISVLRLPNTLTETNVFFESKEGQPETPLRISLPSMMRETSEAFCGNLTRLHEVTFPATLTTLGTRAFYGCTSLDHVVLPAGLRTIEGGAFLGCTSLKDLSIEEGNPALRLEGGTNVMTTGERPTLVIALAPTVPEDAVALGAYVFSNVENAAEIALPAGLETIGDGAFAGASIERITFPDGLKEIGAYAFEGCTKLTSATLPPALKTVGASAFYGSALEEVTLPDGLEEIWEYAFANCRLKEVRLPSSITFVGNYSFGANPIEELTIWTDTAPAGTVSVAADKVGSQRMGLRRELLLRRQPHRGAHHRRGGRHHRRGRIHPVQFKACVHSADGKRDRRIRLLRQPARGGRALPRGDEYRLSGLLLQRKRAGRGRQHLHRGEPYRRPSRHGDEHRLRGVHQCDGLRPVRKKRPSRGLVAGDGYRGACLLRNGARF